MHRLLSGSHRACLLSPLSLDLNPLRSLLLLAVFTVGQKAEREGDR